MRVRAELGLSRTMTTTGMEFRRSQKGANLSFHAGDGANYVDIQRYRDRWPRQQRRSWPVAPRTPAHQEGPGAIAQIELVPSLKSGRIHH